MKIYSQVHFVVNTGANNQEQVTSMGSFYSISTDQFIFRVVLVWKPVSKTYSWTLISYTSNALIDMAEIPFVEKSTLKYV